LALPSNSPLVELARSIGSGIAAGYADQVDNDARFPREAVTELKNQRLLSCYVPKSLGGHGATLTELALMCEELGKHCGATAMVFAMHQIQVACLVHHSLTDSFFASYLTDLAHNEHLIGSVTSEVGVGGDMRSSVCAVELDGSSFVLNKNSTTSSYGAEADDLLVTARTSPAAPSSDQSLVLLRKGQFTMEQVGNWNPMGMRGTGSAPFKLCGRGQALQIMQDPFATISSRSMVPVSHLLWAATWVGNASASMARVKGFIKQQARAKPGTLPPTAIRMAELAPNIQLLRTSYRYLLTEYEEILSNPQRHEELSTVGYAVKMNNLKLSGSHLIVEIANKALQICGVAGYKNDSKFAMGRILRDSHAAALMVGNDRILNSNANMLMILKGD